MSLRPERAALECDGCGREVALRDTSGLLAGWAQVRVLPGLWRAFSPFDGHLCESCAATTTVAALVREATEEES